MRPGCTASQAPTEPPSPRRLDYPISPGFDTHLVLGYRNGEEWYDVHPLVAEEVARQAPASSEASTVADLDEE